MRKVPLPRLTILTSLTMFWPRKSPAATAQTKSGSGADLGTQIGIGPNTEIAATTANVDARSVPARTRRLAPVALICERLRKSLSISRRWNLWVIGLTSYILISFAWLGVVDADKLGFVCE